MGIKSRFGGTDVTKQYLMPPSLMTLFDNALPMGTIMEKRVFRQKHLPDYEKFTVPVGDVLCSIRPAWTDYHYSPNTHLIIVGHILFCHVDPHKSWYFQPSARLWNEDPKDRLRQFKNLINRATKRAGKAPSFDALQVGGPNLA
ncbi:MULTISPECIES: hypothetical protein [unclassified Bradyrhizobium]|uniref:hypothetical protein n=1 Tax=unclassified Bradyrhizobium TaxID=2631580 RepID=UPI0033999466